MYEICERKGALSFIYIENKHLNKEINETQQNALQFQNYFTVIVQVTVTFFFD